MDDISALFDSVDGLKEDLVEYGTIAAGAIGANVLWNIAVAKFGGVLPAGAARRFGLPAAAILAGIFGGRLVGRKNRKLGLGMTIGLVAAGMTQFAKMFVPNLPVAGLSDGEIEEEFVAGLLNSAPATVEELNAVSIEQDGVAGYISALQ
jgi:hypothetical protein